MSDMTRQFKSTEEELINRFTELEKTVDLNNQEINELEQEKKDIEEATKKMKEEKEKEI